MTDYPGTITSFATLVDYVDYVLASHQNTRAAEIVAIETYLGTNIHGTAASLKARLAHSLNDAGYLNLDSATELTITSDAITITQNAHKLQPQSGTTDNLSTISGTADGDFGVLYISDFGTDTVTIKHNVGNILCVGGIDVVLSNGAVAWFSNGTKVFVVGYSGAPATVYPPTGTISMFGGNAAPSGYLLCDGSAVSRTTYADLFAVITTYYGSGNGSTTFNVPDLRSRVPIGLGQGSGGGSSGTGLPSGGSSLTNVTRGEWKGEETHQLTTAELATHTHPPASPLTTFWGYYVSGDGGLAAGTSTYTQSGVSATGATGSGTAHNNVQPVMGVNFIIKT